MHRMTAWRHYNAGTPPPELRPKKIGNIIYVLANPESPTGRIVGYARVSSAEQEPHLENQANRLWAYAGQNGILLDQVVSEIASGLNDPRPKLRKLLGDPTVHTVIVEHRERLARFGVGMVETMLQARGGSLGCQGRGGAGRDCATMPTTTSAGRWSASTTPSVSRR